MRPFALAFTVLQTSLVASFALGCAGKTGDSNPGGGDEPVADETSQLVSDGESTQEAESQATALTSALQLGPTAVLGDRLSPDQAVARADEAASAFRPAGCVKYDKSGTTLTYTFAGCTGPFGLVKISGEVAVTYKAVAGEQDTRGIALDVKATNLSLNRANVTFEAAASLSGNRTSRTMTWVGTVRGTTGRGQSFERQSSWTLGWTLGGNCLALDGHAEGDVAGRILVTDVNALKRCANSCPEAGGKITVQSKESGKSVTLEFDGDDSATFTDANGKASNLPLLCKAD